MKGPHLPTEPFPPSDSYFMVVWLEKDKQWLPWNAPTSREAAVVALRNYRSNHPEPPARLVRETRIYTAEED